MRKSISDKIQLPNLVVGVVDDDPFSAEITSKQLKEQGIQNIKQYTGDDAVRNARKSLNATPGKFKFMVLDGCGSNGKMSPESNDDPVCELVNDLQIKRIRKSILTGTRPSETEMEKQYGNTPVILRSPSAIKQIVHGMKRSDDVGPECFTYCGKKPIGSYLPIGNFTGYKDSVGDLYNIFFRNSKQKIIGNCSIL